jgi:hypothetical protein
LIFYYISYIFFYKLLADRIKGIVLAYVWALLTGRQLSISITHPCPLTQLLLPNKINWDKPIEYFDYNNNSNNSLFTNVRVNKMDSLSLYNELKNLNILKLNENASLIILRSNLDLIKSLAENSALKEKILSLGFVDKIENFKMSSIFRAIYNQLFILAPNLEKKYLDFKVKAKPQKNSKLFCAQIRIGAFGSDRPFTLRKNSKLFWDFMRSTIIKDEKNYKLFVTSDMESVANESITEFGKDKVLMIDGLYNHIDKTPTYNNSCEPFEKTILDMHAFQLCDKVVVSRGGYGVMADFLREKPFQEFFRYTEVFKDEKFKNETFVKFIKISNLTIFEENFLSEIEWVRTHF